MSEVKEKIKKLDEEIKAIRKQAGEIYLKALEPLRPLELEKSKIIKELLPEDCWEGDWECEASPFGFCAYKGNNDDECIYCGEPDERK